MNFHNDRLNHPQGNSPNNHHLEIEPSPSYDSASSKSSRHNFNQYVIGPKEIIDSGNTIRNTLSGDSQDTTNNTEGETGEDKRHFGSVNVIDESKVKLILAEGWIYKKGTGNDWMGSRSWKPRWGRLVVSSQFLCCMCVLSTLFEKKFTSMYFCQSLLIEIFLFLWFHFKAC